MRKQTILLLSLLLLVVLGGFYTQPLVAKEEPLRIGIETVSGDEAVLDGLLYYGTAHSQWETTTLSFDRSGLRHSETQRQDAFFQDYAESAVQIWRDEYKAFMRGKRPFEGNYAETEGKLYYSAAEDDGFLIATLDKADGTVTETLLAYPEKKEKTYYNLNRTDFLEGKVIISYSRYDEYSNNRGTDILICDPVSGMQEEHFAFDVPSDFTGYQSVTTSVLTQGDQKAIFLMERLEEADRDATEYVAPVVSLSFKRYDWTTKDWSTLAAEALVDDLSYAIKDGIFYQLQHTDQEWSIQPLDLMQDQARDKISLQNTADWEQTTDMNWQILISDNRIILTENYLEPDRASKLAVFELQTGEMLYSGEINATFADTKKIDLLYFDKIIYEP
ncbi:MAG: hypothetical protein PWP61_447 [Trichococcus sp.]|nr:hypothetical protein [Trichococcus sp.]